MHQVSARAIDRYACVRKDRRTLTPIQANDGRFYFVKLAAPGWSGACKALGALIARACNIPAAMPAVVHMDCEFVQNAKSLIPNGRGDFLTVGVHFGSLLPADPTKKPIYDLLPLSLLSRVENKEDFGLMQVIDAWIGNVDAAHPVFIRTPDGRFRAIQIGFDAFRFVSGRYSPVCAIAQPKLDDSQIAELTTEGLKRVAKIRKSQLIGFAESIPPSWWEASHISPEQAIAALLLRQPQLPAILSGQIAQRKNPHKNIRQQLTKARAGTQPFP